MRQVLDKQAVKDWLSGQQAASARTEDERVRFLLTLTPERSLEIYLDLWDSGERAQTAWPSPLLMAIRQTFARKAVKESPAGSQEREMSNLKNRCHSLALEVMDRLKKGGTAIEEGRPTDHEI